MPRSDRVTSGSKTTGTRRLVTGPAPRSRVARSTASRAAWLRVEVGEGPADREAVPGSGAVALAGERAHAARGHRAARRGLHSDRARNRRLHRRVAVVRRLDPADPRVEARRSLLERERERDLLGSRHRRRARRATDRGRRPALPLRLRGGQVVPLVGCGEAGVVARLVEHACDEVGLERAHPRVAQAAVDDDPHAHTAALGDRHLLHPRPRTPSRRCRASARRRPRPARPASARPAIRGPEQSTLARSLHPGRAVPPTVSSASRKVGCPDDTGTPCPSLPQVPAQVSKSSPTASTNRSASGSVADQLGGAHRLGDHPVLDQVRLGDPEHEVAGRRVDLAAAQSHAVEPVPGVGDDVGGVGGARQQVRVRHPHHRQVPVGLAPPVATARATRRPRPHQVPHVVGEHAVLDEDVAPRRRALVVDRERAPLVAVGAVVDDVTSGDATCSPTRPRNTDASRRTRSASRPCPQASWNSTPPAPRSSTTGQATRRRRSGPQQGERAVGRDPRHRLGVDLVEELEADGAPGRLGPGVQPGVALGDARSP